MSGSAVNLSSNNVQRSQVFINNANFTVPAGVTEVTLFGVGGGAGGSVGIGGGAGAVPSYQTVTVTPGAVIAVGIAGGGAGKGIAGGGPGSAGGNSTFGSLATFYGAPRTLSSSYFESVQNTNTTDHRGFTFKGALYTSGGATGSNPGSDSPYALGGAAAGGAAGGGAGFGAGGVGDGGVGAVGGGGGGEGLSVNAGNGGSGRIVVYWSQSHD